jgi:hypothetical protein
MLSTIKQLLPLPFSEDQQSQTSSEEGDDSDEPVTMTDEQFHFHVMTGGVHRYIVHWLCPY